MLEEHVHELPQHVVERLDELLADVGIRARRLELPLGADRRRTRSSGTRARARARPPERPRRRPRSVAERDHDVLLAREQPSCAAELAALAREGDRGQRALADDHGVHELDRDVARVRARRRRGAQRDQPPAAREALGHAVAEPREPLGLGREERALASVRRASSCSRRRRARRGSVGERARQASASSRARGDATSQSRHASMPSPVRALTSIARTSGCTWSMLWRQPSRSKSRCGEQVDLVDQHELAGAEHQRVLQRLVLALGDRARPSPARPRRP